MPDLDSHPPELLWSVGASMRKSSNEKSRQLIDLAQLHHIESPIINRDIARRLQREGRPAEAAIHLMISVASLTEPAKQARELLHLADLFINQGDDREGAILLRRAKSLDPNVIPDIRVCRVVSFIDAKLAAAMLEEMIEEKILTSSDAWIELGEALKDLEEYSRAAEAYATGLEIGIDRSWRRKIAINGLLECETKIREP
jgi:tetratricopeptide (TPR) repeat protein